MYSEKNWQLIMSNAIVDGENVWFSNDSFNGLFCMDIKSLNPRWMGSFPDEPFEKRAMHRLVDKMGDYLIFAPWSGHHLHIYNSKNGLFESLQLEKKYDELITGMQIIDNNLFLLPVYPDQKALRVSLDNFFVEEFDFNSFENGELIKGNVARTCAIAKDGRLWFSPMHSSQIFSVDFKQKRIGVYQTDACDIRQIYIVNDDIWGTEYGTTRIWKFSHGETTFYETCFDDGVLGKNLTCWISDVVEFDGSVIAVPGYGHDVLRLDKDGFKSVLNIDSLKKPSRGRIIPFFLKSIRVNDNLLILPYGGGHIIRLDDAFDVADCKLFACEDERDRKRMRQEYVNKPAIIDEGEFISVSEWIAAIKEIGQN